MLKKFDDLKLPETVTDELKDKLDEFIWVPNTPETLKDMQSVLMPIIRRVSPQLLASQIVGVQPMSMPLDNQDEVGENVNEYGTISYWVKPKGVDSSWLFIGTDKRKKKLEKLIEWCTATFNPDAWHRHQNVFYFEQEEDRTVFLLMWAGA
jgi:hypothetical protein